MQEIDFPIDEYVIYETVAGSRLYGCAIEGVSDEDFRGVCVPPAEYVLGLKVFEQYEQEIPDRVIFSLKKLWKLAVGANPNVLEWLFAPSEHILTMTPLGEMVRDARRGFLSKQCRNTFLRYAEAELHEVVESYDEDTGVYDYKHAVNCVRLAVEGSIIAWTGWLYPDFSYQPNNHNVDEKYLLSIRKGECKFTEIYTLTHAIIESARKKFEESSLPEVVDFDAMNAKLVEIHREALIEFT
jgi:predicted nucleotidyltransferase